MTLGSHYPNYVWELTNGWAISVEFIGFLILIFGNLVYNEIVKIRGVYQNPRQENDREFEQNLLDGPLRDELERDRQDENHRIQDEDD